MPIDVPTILSVISIVFAGAIALLSYSSWSFNLTFQFTEKVEIQQKKEKIEAILFKELKERLLKVTNDLDKLPDKDFLNLMWSFGQDALLCTLPSKILSQMSWNFSTIIKKILFTFTGVFIMSISLAWTLNIIPILNEYSNIISPVIVVTGAWLVVMNMNFINMIKNTLKLRNQFNQLSEDINIDKIKEISETIKREGIL